MKPVIIDHTIHIGSHNEPAPKLHYPSRVHIWKVPKIYRETGYFIGVQETGKPEEIPACDIRECQKLGECYLPAHPDALEDHKIQRQIEIREMTLRDIDSERNRRIDAGFEFEGVRYQSGVADRENIAGAVLIAMSDPTYSTNWISSDNSIVHMDAQKLLRFGRKAGEHKSTMIFAARQIKDMMPIPHDYKDDKWWPKS